MKIIALQAENIKRLVAVEIRPDGNLVQITGKNGSGKTSVLDSIWWALAGKATIQDAPIRKGETHARIRLDLGELVIVRTFHAVEGTSEVTTGITVTSASGAKFPSPQDVLNRLLGALSFDPLAFARSAPRAQFEQLRQFAPGVDFDAIDAANDQDYEERAAVNRRAKEARIYAEQIEVPVNYEPARDDESAIVKELADASAHNSDIAARKERRTQVAKQVDDHVRTAASFEEQAKELTRKAQEARDRAQDLRNQLANAADLPAPVDVAGIQARLEEAKATNRMADLHDKKMGLFREAEQLAAGSDAITARMEQRELDKQTAIGAAAMPVDGMGFGKGCILLNGLPFEQASDAEQLRASVAIAMALNPKLKVIRVRDGSLLDEDGMKLLAALAEARDYQVWVEVVKDDGKVGFVLENGRLKGAVKQKEEA